MDEAHPDYLATMLAVAQSSATSFVVFESGTVVALAQPTPDTDLAIAARDILSKFGPVQVGSTGGDFGLMDLVDDLGWAVTSHHPDIFTLVLVAEVEDGANALEIGLLGREKRGQDARDQRVAGVVDRRPAA